AGDLHAPARRAHHRARIRAAAAGARVRACAPGARGRLLQRRRGPLGARPGAGPGVSATLAIVRFELSTKLRRLSTWVYFTVFAVAAMLWMAAAGGAFASANIIFSSDKVFINSPYAVGQTVTMLAVLGTVVIAAFMGRAVQQDFETLAFP